MERTDIPAAAGMRRRLDQGVRFGQQGRHHRLDPLSERARESRSSVIRQITDVAKCRILVVEDELLIALEIDSILTGAGFEVLGPASSNAEALRLIEREPIDGAFLDANLGGSTVDDVAERLAEHAIPFVFVTGYTRENLPRAFRSRPVINKPFAGRQLLQAARTFADPAAP
jgi:CheY-like chemotaxis protein